MKQPLIRRGFTLLEMVTVLGIIGVLAAVSLASLTKIRARATFNGATGDLISALRMTRAESLARGADTAFIIDMTPSASAQYGGRYWGIQTTSTFDLSTFNPAVMPAGSMIMVQGQLPYDVQFGPAAGWGAALSVPLVGIPTTTGSPAYNYCSFCKTASPTAYGSLLFDPGGKVVASAPTATVGEQFSMFTTRDGITRRVVVAIVRQTGMIETFEK